MADIPRTETDLRDARVVQGLMEGKPAIKAIVDAGYSYSTAAHRAVEITTRSLKKSPMISALDNAGVTTERLAKKIAKGLKAKKVQRLVCDKQVQEFVDEDHAIQKSYVDLAVKLRGEEPDRRTEGSEETYEQRVMRLRGISAVPMLPEKSDASEA